MIKIIRSQLSQLLIFRMFPFTSSKTIESSNYFCRTKSDQLCQLIKQNRSFVSTSPPSITIIDYHRFKKFLDQNEALIIDVRTKEELAATGILPNSHNIPIDELSTAFKLTPKDFLNKYNFPKPDTNINIIFSCAKGIRSSNACKVLAELGYTNLFNYMEGWYGWESRHK